MREIKFRVWHTKQNRMIPCEEMVRNQLTLLPDGRFINVNGRHVNLSTIYPPDKFIPLQYTGLKDKNGKESYHKDIVKMAMFTYIIEWDIESAKFYLKPTNPLNTWKYTMRHLPKDGEIIGNIYENPELLGETNKPRGGT